MIVDASLHVERVRGSEDARSGRTRPTAGRHVSWMASHVRRPRTHSRSHDYEHVLRMAGLFVARHRLLPRVAVVDGARRTSA